MQFYYEYAKRNVRGTKIPRLLATLEKLKMNVEVYLANPVGIGEHPDVLGAIQDQIDLIAKEEERLEVIEKYFEDK